MAELWALVLAAALVAIVVAFVGLYDILQPRHTILRIYPVIGHFRFWLELISPEIHQYFIENDLDGRPFSRERRSIIYQRSKDVIDSKPFGTNFDLYEQGAEWINHSISPVPTLAAEPRVHFGGEECTQPYDASHFNISAMSFGSLSAAAVRALNQGARLGGFAHNTGEGGLSKYHLEGGGDVIWQIGTGYFGCRTHNGEFDPALFQDNARHDAVKMIEIKLSQGAKPGHGGILPAPKVTQEIADVRHVKPFVECVSPSHHTAFSTPVGLLDFVARLREMSGGKPVGFKLCLGRPEEFLGICKAMLQTGIAPDFITVDGAEGGTGAAPMEFSNSIGTPLTEGLIFVHNAIVGIGLRDQIKIIASGKVITGFDIAAKLALGADACNSARGMMFALGCIQALRCHLGTCPTGVATQSSWRQRGLVVEDKNTRVANFHRHTVESFLEVIAAAGVEHPDDLRPEHISIRMDLGNVQTYAQLYDWLEPGALAAGGAPARLMTQWNRASADSFTPKVG